MSYAWYVGGIFELISALISLAVRVGIVVIATPIVLAWPRHDRSCGYWQCVRNRYVAVFKVALF